MQLTPRSSLTIAATLAEDYGPEALHGETRSPSAEVLAQDALGILPSADAAPPRVRLVVGRMDAGYARSLRMSYSVGYERSSSAYPPASSLPAARGSSADIRLVSRKGLVGGDVEGAQIDGASNLPSRELTDDLIYAQKSNVPFDAE